MNQLDLGPATREVTRLLAGVPDEALSGPTPCPEYPVGALLDHLMGLTLAFTWAARKSGPGDRSGVESGPGQARFDNLDPRWRSVLPARLEELAAAWVAPEAWEGFSEAGGIRMPSEVTGLVALDEVVLHGWDLARATGQSYTVGPADAEAVLRFTEASSRPEQAAGREGLFGSVVPVAGDASVFDRALGYAGRDPGWAPAAAPSRS
jgi:uncharacterized protein (TIGR03086 family)